MQHPSGNTRTAIVKEALPNARYRVVLEHGEEMLAHVSGDMRMRHIRILPGDEVAVEVSPFDTTKGRILLPQGTRNQIRNERQNP